MPIGRLAAVLAVALTPATIHAQSASQDIEYLSRAEVEAHMRDSAFCYYPSTRFSCAWAELYTELNEDHAVLHSASASLDGPLSVVEFRVEWDGNALCVDHETQGLIAAREADGYRFPFDLGGLRNLPEEDLPELLDAYREASTPDACFRYSNDTFTPGQIRQHVYYDGEPQQGFDPIALIPLFGGGIAINPG